MGLWEPVKIVRNGKTHTLSYQRIQRRGKWEWAVLVDGKPWAVGKRIRQGQWVVTAGDEQRRGLTLEHVAIGLFYDLGRQVHQG